jgi:branched-chain amino acid transport system ATP-binding protein
MTAPRAATTPVLDVSGLSINFGGLTAVDDVSFTAGRHTITTVIGPNGAGKSTLFNLISGSLRPRRGRVLLEGRDMTGAPPHKLQAAGLARSFQITTLFFALSVAENLRLGAQALESSSRLWLPVRASARARHRVEELLERFRLADKARYPAGKLSHGEQRRLEIAVALAGEPRVLLLDEPTQGMSHGDTAEAADLIRGLAGDLTIVLIEHDIGLVMTLSDHVIVMHQGRKIAEGRPEVVRADPAVQTAYLGQV